MRKIAILAPYVGTINRGAETFVIELTERLIKNYEIDVYTLASEQTIEKNICIVRVNKSIIFKIHERFYRDFKLYRKIVNKFYFIIPDVLFQKKFTQKAFKIIENKEYDLLFPNNGIWGVKYSDRLRKRKSIPFIYTGHGGIGLGEKYIIDTKPNAYVCLTNKHLAWANSIKNKDTQCLVIPNGVSVMDFNTRDKATDKIIILSVAALTEFKRHELTILAVSKIPNANLIILGKGEEEKRLKKLAERYLHGRCTITSASYDSIKEYYCHANLFVLPSREEPFGIVYLEAMASNLPIVAPDDNQRREIISDAGLYCNVENPDEYAKTIQHALQLEWGNKPLERAKRFDWNNIAKEYYKLINQIIDRK